jgi:hypothetical protein
MLNKKKNLLQRVRIAMVAIVTIMSVGGALAMKAPSHQANKTYGAFSVTATGNHYVTTQTAVTAGSYSCDAAATPCTVISSVAPTLRNGSWEVPKADASISQTGAFTE